MTRTADAAAVMESTVSATPDETTSVDASQTSDDKDKHPDIWARIRKGYGLPPLDSHLIARHEQWFVNNPEYLQAMMERARLYLHHIVEEVEKRNMPMEIALLPAIESAYKPYAYSRAKASGLWQFIAPTGRLYGLNMNWWYDERRDVMASTSAALDYLEKLHRDFNGDWHLALAAYNAGEGKISRMMRYNQQRGKPTTYQYLKLRAETINYVPKLIAMANIVANPEKYGVTLLPIPDAPYFTRVDTGSQIDLEVVSRLTDIPVSELQRINPHLNRWSTAPEGPHHLLIPVEKKDVLLEALANLPPDERVQWRGHQVRKGDTLHGIARKFGVTTDAIRRANNLRSNMLRVGQNLMIPVSARTLPPIISTSTQKSRRPAPSWDPDAKLHIIHRVRAGETLWSISRRYGVLVSQIAKWNLISPNEVLKLGQKLKIYVPAKPSASLLDDSLGGPAQGDPITVALR